MRKYTKGGLLAPNGKPSNLNAEQYKLVRTPEFKQWFGDWENDPKNASKIVDENGEPLVVYHGTYVENPFYVFDFSKADLGFHFGTYEQAKDRSETKPFFANKKSVINPFFLNIKTLFYASDIGEWEYPQRYIDMLVSDNIITESEAKKNGFYRAYDREDNKSIRDFIINKYDDEVGFAYNNKHEGEGESYIVLNESQIKLADGTNTIFDKMSNDIRYQKGGLIAPNGNKSNLTPEQYKLVRTKSFKQWFGDWENDPENASKVVDDNGEPLVVYHGTNVEFYEFDLKYFGKTDKGWYGKGFYFTPNKNFTFAKDAFEQFGGKEITLELFLNIKNPFYGEAYSEQNSNLVGSAKDRNNDGVIVLYDYGHELERQIAEIVVWESTQIKLADGTNTTFDKKSDDIRYQKGGLIAPNGNKSNLTLEQYKLVRTKAFKQWFGDWENNPENASKVVDENGEPLVVYHGTDKYFNTFKLADNKKLGWNIKEYGIYFTNSIFTATQYSYEKAEENQEYLEWETELEKLRIEQDWEGWQELYSYGVDKYKPNPQPINPKSVRILKCFLNIRNPFVKKANGSRWFIAFKNVMETAINNNDGVIVENVIEMYNDIQNTYVAFDPKQIKLADGTNTTFDKNSDDIRYEKGGVIESNKKVGWSIFGFVVGILTLGTINSK
jgi:hypothetical protein